MDNSIVGLDEDAYMVIVLDDEEEEKSPEKPSANNGGAGPSRTAVCGEQQDIDPQYASIFRNLGGETPSEEGQDSLLVVAGASTVHAGVVVPNID